MAAAAATRVPERLGALAVLRAGDLVEAHGIPVQEAHAHTPPGFYP